MFRPILSRTFFHATTTVLSTFCRCFSVKSLFLLPKKRSGGFAPLTPHWGPCPLDSCWGSAPDPVDLRLLGATALRPLRHTSPSLKLPPPLQSPWIRPCL